MTKAADNIRRWRERPDLFVREVFGVTPDPWQDDVFRAFPSHQRQAMQASKGPGKTALLSWIAWNFLATRPFPKIAATSITADTLADTLWTEMAKWQTKSPFLMAAFEWQKTRIFSREHPETWWMSARSWSKTADANQQANTLAGSHADYILFLIDEAGGIPDAVMAAAEAALSSCIEGHLVIAGNPTHLSGPLYRAATTERRLWHVTEITSDPDDPKRTPRVSIPITQPRKRTRPRHGHVTPPLTPPVLRPAYPPAPDRCAARSGKTDPSQAATAHRRPARDHQASEPASPPPSPARTPH
jgi:hypothetical protein